MHSSSSDNDSEAMFPSSDHQPQIRGDDPLLDTSELSPPLSQDAPSHKDLAPQLDVDLMDMGPGQAQDGSSRRDPMAVGSVFSKGPEKSTEPGHAWKNKKAKDEYSRAMDQVVDRNFNLSKCLETLGSKRLLIGGRGLR